MSNHHLSRTGSLQRPRLGDALLNRGGLDQSQLDHALAEQAATPGRRLGATLVDMGYATEEDVAAGLAAIHGLPLLDVSDLTIDSEFARLVPQMLAERHTVLVYGRHADRLQVAVADPVDVVALDDVRSVTGVSGLDVGVAVAGQIMSALAHVWAQDRDESALRDFADENVRAVSTENDNENDAATVRLVDRMLSLALRMRASDVHVEPHPDGVHVRMRVDGVLVEAMQAPLAGHPAMIARLKIISDLDVIERRLPQDGRARVRIDDRDIDLRTSTLPTLRGEKAVLRLLPPVRALTTWESLGLEPSDSELLMAATSLTQGLVIMTGPTGSGKTSSLYAALSLGIDRRRHVVTLEDPVEIELPGITQVQIDERIGLTFARGLRAALRQDPDVILVGEIRDHETAELAVRAALTGHLVLATMHTNDAAAAVTRLMDIGLPQYLVASTLALVVAQRLVRVPCAGCAVPAVEVGVPNSELDNPDTAAPARWLAAVGCGLCGSSGYRGRTAVAEVIPVSGAIRAAILAGGGEEQVRAVARSTGVKSLFARGVEKARRGDTTLDEVYRALPVDP